MNHCQTCKHWQPVGDDYGALKGAGVCAKVLHTHQVATLQTDPTDEWVDQYVLKPEFATVLATVEDGSGYKAELITMPTFGCVQHEEKTS